MKGHLAFALVDCNNFYVSCERVFNPRLRNVPVAVLSSNDGCIVARSNEVKALGIKMGAPAFKCEDLIRAHNIRLLSSNYSLYADMSSRVMSTLREFTPYIEVYSVDEAFLLLSRLNIADYEKYCRRIKDTVLQWTGIPVSIGIASTKGLAKIASIVAKKNPLCGGVADFTKLTSDKMDSYLEQLDVADIWGVGRQLGKWLRANGVATAKDFKYSSIGKIKKKLGVMGERCLLELQGVSCFKLNERPQVNKSICCSRSFGKSVTTQSEMSEAIATFSAQAAEKLRSQKAYANILIVFIMTNRFKKGEKQYFNSVSIKLPYSTSSTIDITMHALIALNKIYKSGYKYKKVGVILEGIEEIEHSQFNMFYKHEGEEDRRKVSLMKTVDRINQRFGPGSIKLAAEGITKAWRGKRVNVSARYTTCYNEILTIRL